MRRLPYYKSWVWPDVLACPEERRRNRYPDSNLEKPPRGGAEGATSHLPDAGGVRSEQAAELEQVEDARLDAQPTACPGRREV
jgi:hypothetical protein